MATTPMSKLLLPLAVLILLLVPAGVVQADDTTAEAAAEARMRQLRDALKSMTVQLRDAQNQVVTAQTAQAASDAANKDLQAKVDDLAAKLAAANTQAAADKTAADKSIADLNEQLTQKTTQNTALTDDLKKQKDAYSQVAQLEALKENERLKLAAACILLQRLVADREVKNLELFKTGNEILVRYEKFSLGDALAAKEPFIGLTRVKLENLVQGYKDKLLDNAVVSGQPPTALPPGSPPATPPPKTAPPKNAKAAAIVKPPPGLEPVAPTANVSAAAKAKATSSSNH